MTRLKKLLILCGVVFLTSCTIHPENISGDIIGKYNINNRGCFGSSAMIEQCESIKIIEFVHGSFYKVSNDEIAFVVWSGNKGEELMYSSRKYYGNKAILKSPFIAEIDQSEGVSEFVEFFNDNLGRYELTKKSLNGDVSFQMLLDIERVYEDSPVEYITIYPGND